MQPLPHLLPSKPFHPRIVCKKFALDHPATLQFRDLGNLG